MIPNLSQLRFASDATLIAMWGAGLLLFAVFAVWAEARRTKRKRIDSVGWMPWTKIFFVAALVGLTLLTMAIKGWASAE